MKNLETLNKFNSIFLFLMALFTVAVVVVTTTLAYFISNDWADNGITMAGPVLVSCVGSSDGGYLDITGSGNLEISVPDVTDSSILIPNMPVGLRANAKIAYADSIALLRAKLDVTFTNIDEFTSKTPEEIDSIYDLFYSAIETTDSVVANWVKVDDYWYYVGSNTRDGAETLLVVINHNSADNNTTCDYVDDENNSYIKFIDSDFRIPKDIDSSWSTLKVVIKITFEAVQGFIPDSTGVDIGDSNKTISKALPIFNNENISA